MAKRKLTKLPELTTCITRFVFIHTKGKYRGMSRIVGLSPELQQIVKRDGPPDFFPDLVVFDGDGGSLVKVRNGTAYYRQIMPPPATGKLGDFHPQQV